MNWAQYRKTIHLTDTYADDENGMLAVVLGLLEETTELLLHIPERGELPTEEAFIAAHYEIGDVYWYLANLCNRRNIDVVDAESDLQYHDLQGAMLNLLLVTGGVASWHKKSIRDRYTDKAPNYTALVVHLQRVYTTLGRICTYLGTTQEKVLRMNRNKLDDRKRRGMISGSGDNR